MKSAAAQSFCQAVSGGGATRTLPLADPRLVTQAMRQLIVADREHLPVFQAQCRTYLSDGTCALSKQALHDFEALLQEEANAKGKTQDATCFVTQVLMSKWTAVLKQGRRTSRRHPGCRQY